MTDHASCPHADGVICAATLDDAAADPALTLEGAREMLRDAAAAIRHFHGLAPPALSDDWARALRLADDAAESVICTEGHNTKGRQWALYQEQIAADPYLGDAIAHLEWRGLADVDRESDGVRLTFRG